MEIKWLKEEDVLDLIFYSDLDAGDVFSFSDSKCLALKLDKGHVLFEHRGIGGKVSDVFDYRNGYTVQNSSVICHGKLVGLGLI